jgi:hypothetical protein
MENPALIRVSLSDVRDIMVIMCVLVVELLCQAMMGWNSVLECLLPGTRGRWWLHLILPGIKWTHYLRTPALGPLARYLGYPWAWLPGPERMLIQGVRAS